MQRSTSQTIGERPSTIVCIAYHQLSRMTGIADPTEPPKIDETPVVNVADDYTTLKGLREAFTAIVNSTTGQRIQGIEYLDVVTEKFGNAIETPRQNIDNAINVCLEFWNKNISTIEIPTQKICDTLMDSFRSTIAMLSAMKDNIQESIKKFMNADGKPIPSLALTYKSENDSSAKDKS